MHGCVRCVYTAFEILKVLDTWCIALLAMSAEQILYSVGLYNIYIEEDNLIFNQLEKLEAAKAA